MISILLAKSRNNVIGKDNALPWHIPEDLRYFKKRTTGNSVVMGRRTFESIGRPLPNRENYVLTHDPAFHAENVYVIHSIEDIRRIPGEVFIIGGASLVKQTLSMADVLYLTEIHADVEGDTFLNVDLSNWVLRESMAGNQDRSSEFEYDFNVYVRK